MFKKALLGLGAIFVLFNSTVSFANNKTNLNLEEVVSKFKPESQAIINSSDSLTMEKLANILNIEAGENLIAAKNGTYVVLKNVSSERSYEISKIRSSRIFDLMKVKYRGDVRKVKYLDDFSDAIMKLYDDSHDYDHIKNMGKK